MMFWIESLDLAVIYQGLDPQISKNENQESGLAITYLEQKK